MNSKYLRELLRDQLLQRDEKGKAQSKRAFAAKLGISHGALIEIMSGKRSISFRMVHRICDQLELSPLVRQRVMTSFTETEKKSPSTKYDLVHRDQAEIIANWQHFAILSLIQLPGIEATTAFIAERLGISQIEAVRSLNRLERAGFVEENEEKVWISACGNLTTTDEVKNASIEQSHKNFLHLASQKIREVSAEHRDYTTITMGINPQKLNLAKKLVRDFQDQLSALLEDQSASEVYIFGTQLIPVTQFAENKQ